MTNWSREYWHRLFVGRGSGPPTIPGQECLLADHDVELFVRAAQDGPYSVRVVHDGVSSGTVVEDAYRETPALDELFAEWIEHQHDMACICGDGGVSWCPQHGTLWYDFEGNQYRVDDVGWPDPPEREASIQQLVDSGVFA